MYKIFVNLQKIQFFTIYNSIHITKIIFMIHKYKISLCYTCRMEFKPILKKYHEIYHKIAKKNKYKDKMFTP